MKIFKTIGFAIVFIAAATVVTLGVNKLIKDTKSGVIHWNAR